MRKGYSRLDTYTRKWHPIRHVIEAMNNASANSNSQVYKNGDIAIKMVRCEKWDGTYIWELRGTDSGFVYGRFVKRIINHVPQYKLVSGCLLEDSDLAVYRR